MRELAIKSYAKLQSLKKDEKGDIVQTSVIIGILAILAIAVLTMLREPITDVFNAVRDGLVNAL